MSSSNHSVCECFRYFPREFVVPSDYTRLYNSLHMACRQNHYSCFIQMFQQINLDPTEENRRRKLEYIRLIFEHSREDWVASILEDDPTYLPLEAITFAAEFSCMNAFRSLVRSGYSLNSEVMRFLEQNYAAIRYNEPWWRDYLQTIPESLLRPCPRLRHFIDIRKRILQFQEETKQVLSNHIPMALIKYGVIEYL